MSDTSIYAFSPAQQIEVDALRDQRDLYRSLLLSDLSALGEGLPLALGSVEHLRQMLRATTRDQASFRGKIEQLLAELDTLAAALQGLHLPTVAARIASAQAALREIGQRAEITGNDLLPAMVVLGELCSHITIAADCASVHVPLGGSQSAADEIEGSDRRPQPKLAIALKQLTERTAAEHGKHVTLVTLGLEDIPEVWVSALFDLVGQLVRNAVEHGIESPERRAELDKPEQGTLVVEFVDRGHDGFELNVQDDGGGLDAKGIADIAVRKGLLAADAAADLDPPKLASLIFQPGVTTARDAPRRGHGMRIVRDHVQRLGGKIQAATKSARYTRFRIHLPAIESPAAQAGAASA
jgi:signal transduction histidine kinase